MSGALGRSRAVLREEGLSGLWWRGLAVTVYRRTLLFGRDLAAFPSRTGTTAALDDAQLRPEDVGQYLRLRPDQERREIEHRLATGQRCQVVRLGGEIVAARWLSVGFAEIPYLGLTFDLAPDVAYVHDVYTAPSARERGIATASRPGYERFLADRGVRTLVAVVWLQNRLGMSYLGGLPGWRPLGRVDCLRLGPFRIPIKRTPAGLLGSATRFRPAV